MGEGGFEPPKSVTTDLQSAPFGRSGIPPYKLGAGGRIRTPDLLITNQLLYRLSYTSKLILEVLIALCSTIISRKKRFVNSFFAAGAKLFFGLRGGGSGKKRRVLAEYLKKLC